MSAEHRHPRSRPQRGQSLQAAPSLLEQLAFEGGPSVETNARVTRAPRPARRVERVGATNGVEPRPPSGMGDDMN